MGEFYSTLPLWLWGAAFGIAFLAGVVKGIIGFALPLVIVSGLGALMSPEIALAGMIIPTVVTNIMQATRGGLRSAGKSAHQFRLFLACAAVTLLLAAQIVPLVSEKVFLLMLGLPIILYVPSQLLGWTPSHVVQTARFDFVMGSLVGFLGGIAGVWGPPTVAYLTALNTPKAIQVQIQGVIYLCGAVFLILAHAVSGILTVATALFSVGLVPAAVAGMLVGTRIQDRINQKEFRRATLFVLFIAGLNLVRRGILA